jgi:tryptophanyl-tRNA synthetase
MKKQLAADICKVTLPIREKIDAVYNDTDYLRKVTQMGRDKARESANATLALAKKAVGFKVF